MRTLHFINVQFNTAFGWAGKCILILLRLGAVQKWRTVVIATMTTKVTCLFLHKLLDRYNWMVLIGSLSQMDRLATVYWDSLMQVGTVILNVSLFADFMYLKIAFDSAIFVAYTIILLKMNIKFQTWYQFYLWLPIQQTTSHITNGVLPVGLTRVHPLRFGMKVW